MYDSMVMLSVGTNGSEDRANVFQDLSELARNLDATHGYVSVSTSRVGEDPDNDVDYCNREHLRHDANTLFKIRIALTTALGSSGVHNEEVVDNCITELQNAGILFRERS